MTRFARLLRERLGAERVILFGSRARNQSERESDYDIIVVSQQFAKQERRERSRGLRQMWYQAGGHGPMDLFCLTPDEFTLARSGVAVVAAAMSEAVDLLPTEEAAVP